MGTAFGLSAIRTRRWMHSAKGSSICATKAQGPPLGGCRKRLQPRDRVADHRDVEIGGQADEGLGLAGLDHPARARKRDAHDQAFHHALIQRLIAEENMLGAL